MWCWGWRWGISIKSEQNILIHRNFYIWGFANCMIKRETFVCFFALFLFCSMLIHLQEKINNLSQIDQVEREQFCSPPYAQDITVYPEKKKKNHYFYLSLLYWQHLEVKRQMWADWIFKRYAWLKIVKSHLLWLISSFIAQNKRFLFNDIFSPHGT